MKQKKPKIEIKISPENTKNLHKFYKKTRKCRNCGRIYGSDLKKDDGICPVCFTELHGWKLGRKVKNE